MKNLFLIATLLFASSAMAAEEFSLAGYSMAQNQQRADLQSALMINLQGKIFANCEAKDWYAENPYDDVARVADWHAFVNYSQQPNIVLMRSDSVYAYLFELSADFKNVAKMTRLELFSQKINEGTIQNPTFRVAIYINKKTICDIQ